jgi:soluble lytic murein transglycosylase
MKVLGQKLIGLHQSSRWRAEALLTVANQETLDEESGQPQRYFEACAATQVESLSVAHCTWRVAFAAHLARRANAFALMAAFAERYPASPHVSAAIYYLGRLSESKSVTDAASYYQRAAVSFPIHYYGVLARSRLESKALRGVTAQPAFEDSRFAAPPVAGFDPDAETKLRTERAQMLVAAGLDDYAERELRFHLRGGGPAHLVAQSLAQLASRQGDHGRAVRLIKGIFPGYLMLPLEKAPAAFWKLAYPLPYRESLERYAGSQGLDPFLVAGLIRQESEFNPKVISRSRAHGLMQVMPATGREIARKVGVKRFTNSMLLDPEVSLKFGTHHFKKWLDAEQGRVEVTLAAYNAGKTRADRWIKRHQFREPAEFIETIPFLETREYVQSVLRNADFYRRLYGPAR